MLNQYRVDSLEAPMINQLFLAGSCHTGVNVSPLLLAYLCTQKCPYGSTGQQLWWVRKMGLKYWAG